MDIDRKSRDTTAKVSLIFKTSVSIMKEKDFAILEQANG